MSDFYVALGANAQLHLQAYEASYDTPSNTSVVQANVWLERTAGTGRYSSYTNNNWSDNIDGQGASGSGTYDLRGGGSQLLLSNSFTIAHNSDGTRSIGVSAYFNDPHANIGTGTASGTLVLTTIPRYPDAPSFTSIDTVTAVSFLAHFTAPGNVGGSAITGYTLQTATDSGFTAGVQNFTGGSSATQISATSETPSTGYYARVKATNSQGDSPWSGVLTTTTAAAGAPHLAVVPSSDGTFFWITCTPPFSVGSVTSYTITRSVSGPGAPTPVTIVTTLGEPNIDVLTLAPGQTVTYRVTALISGTTTGSSNSVSYSYQAVVPKAPINPMFAGSTQPKAPYLSTQATAWLGVAHASISGIRGTSPQGWRSFSDGAGALAKGTVTQIAKILGVNQASTGNFDVMAVFGSTQSAAGVRIGMTSTDTTKMASIFASVNYFASIVAEVDVATRLACEIEWYASNGTLVGRTTGLDVLLSPNTPTTLVANGTAPTGAVYASVETVDVAGTGWTAGSLRFVGSAMLSASKSYPYFDGDTPSDTNYIYKWSGSSAASYSTRTTLASGGTVLQDPTQPTVPAPPSAPVVEESAITSSIVWRRYVAAIPATQIFAYIDSIPTLALYATAVDEHQVRIRYWANPSNLAASVWTDAGAKMLSEQIVSYIPAGATFTIDGVSERAWVVLAGTTTQIAADHLLFGTNGGPTDWPALDCGSAYIVTLDVPITATPGNLVPALNLTSRLL